MGAIMKLREMFEGAGSAVINGIEDLIKLGGRTGAKTAEKEIGAIAKPETKVIPAAKTAAKDKEKKSGSAIGIIFGRFNPPHKGHKAAWQMASKLSYWYVGTNKDTQGPKDPLPYDIKIEAMKTVWPGVEGHLMAEQSWLTLASHCFKSHPDAKTLVCFTDEDWVTKTVQQYNGVQAAHGFYKFDEIKQQETPRLSSATELRNAVRNGDRKAFAKAAGVPAETPVAGYPFFDLVAHYLAKYPEKVSKAKTIKEANSIVRKIREGRGGTQYMKPEEKAAMKNAMTLPALNMSTGSGGAYMNYRMAIALAGAPTFPTKIEADNWIGGDPLISSYTEEEFAMVKAAAEQVGAGTIQNWSGKRSEEMADVNKTSTVAKPKKNKYGV
jgi:hypothetical protein